MAARTQKRPAESIGGLYGAIPFSVLDSVAFQGATYPAKALLFDLMRQHTGGNNGHLHLSYLWLEKRGWKSRDVVQRAKAELIKRGLAIETKRGGLNIGAARFAVTWLQISNFVGLDVRPSSYHPGAWALMDILPMGKNAKGLLPDGKGFTAKQYDAVPPDGKARASPVP